MMSKRLFKRFLKKLIPKIPIDYWHIQFYNRKGHLEWTRSRPMPVGANITDLRVAFGLTFPCFCLLPRKHGADKASILTTDHGTYKLFKLTKKGIP